MNRQRFDIGGFVKNLSLGALASAAGCYLPPPQQGGQQQPYYQQPQQYQGAQSSCAAPASAEQPASQHPEHGALLAINTTPALASLAVETSTGWMIFGSSGWVGGWDSGRPRIRATMGGREMIFRINTPGVIELDMNSLRVMQGDVELLSPAQAPAWQQQPPRPQPQPQPQQPLPASPGAGISPENWAQRAITRMQQNLANPNFSQMLANQIQAYTHPSGNSASMAQGLVGRAMGSMSRVVVTMTVNWRGGIVGSAYSTQVQWIFSQSGQESVTITGDNAPTAVAESNRAQLENYLRQMYDEMKLQIR